MELDGYGVAAKFHVNLTFDAVLDCLDAGADLDARSESGGTPLHSAAVFSENPAALEALLDAGADLHMRIHMDTGPCIVRRLRTRNPAILAVLLDAGADVNAHDNDLGLTPLHLAAGWNENPAVLTALLDAGADPTLMSDHHETPLDLALHERRPAEVVEILRTALAAVANTGTTHSVDCSGWKADDEDTQLSFYENVTREVVLACLDAGADLHARDRTYGGTPLHWAAFANDDVAVLVTLLDAGADPHVGNDRGYTPLHYAADNGNSAVLAALLDVGADPNVRGTDGSTPLHWAAWDANTATLSALLEAGADPNARDGQDLAPLHWAAWNGDSATLSSLLDAGADPTLRSTDGQTPLDVAVKEGRPAAIVETLRKVSVGNP